MLEKGILKKQNLGMPAAYLHTSSIIKENECEIDKLLANWKSMILCYYNKVELLLETEYEESNKADFVKKIKEDVLREPIAFPRAKYRDLLDNIKKCAEKNCKIEEIKRHLKAFKEYLDSELEVKEIDEKVKLYKYNNSRRFGNENV